MDAKCQHIFLLLWILFICRLNVLASEDCLSKVTCSECIQAGSRCAWCWKNDSNLLARNRCNSVDHWNTLCPNQFEFPINTFSIVKKTDLSDPNANQEEIVQLWPQEVYIKVKPRTPHRFEVKFRQAKDYPVDLYFLMDLSFSMNDDKQKLADLGTTLGNQMKNITKDFHLGFGSFVDKTVAPYVSILPSKLISPCTGCAAPYGFINHMPLSTNVSQFVNEVRNSQISGNLDTPEGGFDAIMQAIVCDKNIGWRNVSRKILLVATDAGFHFAGDGKLGGIIKPNDEQCHLDSNGYYTESKNMDYPSISQIKNLAIKNNIHIIFAATTETFHIYDELKKLIEGSYAGKLASDSRNIVDLVKHQYLQISSTVELKDNAPNDIQVKYYSRCTDTFAMYETKTCKNLKVGTEVSFDVELTVTKCPDNKHRIEKFEISPVGLRETLIVNVELICSCSCEHQGQSNSGYCNGTGTHECGICSCNADKRGTFCQCSSNKEFVESDETLCQPTAEAVACSGRGRCSCGECICDKRPKVYGTFCECEDICSSDINGEICGGLRQGHCECGKCICNPGWQGDHCECRSSNNTCIGSDGVYCSNNGRCQCGVCNCNKDFDGSLCEISLALKCNNYSNCAYCVAFPKLSEEHGLDCEHCRSSEFLVQDSVAVVDDRREFGCRMEDKDDCLYYFVYSNKYEGRDTPPQTRVQSKRECPEPVNAMIVSTSVIAAILAIGLALLLLWKITTTIYDRREYAKFVQNCENAKWDKVGNPTYVPSTTTYANPTYSNEN